MSSVSAGTKLARTVTKRYILALSLIAFAALSGAVALQVALASQSSHADVINVAGAQRMLSQRIVALSANALRAGSDVERREVLARLESSTIRMENGHIRLTQLGTSSPPKHATPQLQAHYDDAPVLLDARVRQFQSQARAFFDQGGTDPELANALAVSGLGPLLHDLDHAVQLYQLNAEADVHFIKAVHYSIVAVSLALLVLELLFIFRPMARIARVQADALDEARQHALAAKEDLEVARRAAEVANEAKSSFLSNMSHEIRTPLNGVLGMAEVLADTPLQADQRDMLDTMRQSGWSLLSLLNDILDLARIEAGKFDVDPALFALDALVYELGSLHGANARVKGIGFNIDCALESEQRRIGDEKRIRQILHNLLGNAVKFTESGTVTLHVTPTDEHRVLFRISDTGIGMSEEQLSRIFQPFEQAEPGTARRFGGSGLGMSIVQRLVDVMSGTIDIDSAPGKGTSIELRLALPVDCEAQPGSLLSSHVPLNGSPDAEYLRGLRVLAADDNTVNRTLLSVMMARLGVYCVFAQDGAEAVAIWRKDDFDLVLLDISMPVMDGLETLRQMQQEAAASEKPSPRAVAATGNVMPDQIEAYLAAGFIGILPKPFRRDDLYDALVSVKRK